MFKFKKIKPKVLNLLDTYWITNFYILGDFMYVIDVENNLFSIKNEQVLENLKTNIHTNKFLVNPLSGNIIERKESELTFLNNFNQQIINLSLIDKQLYITTLVDNKTFNYKLENNEIKLLGELNNKLVFANDNDQLIYKDWITKHNSLNLDFDIKKVFINNNIIFIVLDKELYMIKDSKLEKVYSSDKRIQACKFDDSSVIISDMNLDKTFCYNFVLNKNVNDISKKFYYRLDCYEQKFIVGKSLYDYDKHINYYLPLDFIYI
ncbi:hypothetical protein NX779_00995 [Mycoplasma cottewii]|uniref:Uncharacterized protein n=1 Tax=Mycoplasma cottewii TaxID=51364 RepID=A0ABY5TX10_9MOLU|nr:hypothetical protein [Mycoplasma cottewii]UWD35209.1 hypothetical protein NX779_00995 [Mycoplasma cottewii]